MSRDKHKQKVRRCKTAHHIEVKRITPEIEIGLTDAQVLERKNAGLINSYAQDASKSIKRIIVQNVCTLFNLINLILFVAVLFSGSYKNMLFMGVVLSNLLIGTIQELRAKRAVDRLSLISSSAANVIRAGKSVFVPTDQVVADDIIVYRLGSQIVTDGVVLRGECEVNEAFLTGESKPVRKHIGDRVLSGSFITEGTCIVHADNVGGDAYLNTLVSGAKQLKFAASEIMNTLKYIIRVISIAIFPIGAALIFRQINLSGIPIHEAIISVVAALIGMIPEGLMLLTSTVLAVGTIRLSKHGVLTRELYCIESLARVDTLCLDKTGTLTEGNLEVRQTILLNDTEADSVKYSLNTLVHALDTQNATFNSLKTRFFDDTASYGRVAQVYEFSSDTKWSGVTTTDGETYIIGAPEWIINPMDDLLMREVKTHASKNRLLMLAKTDKSIKKEGARAILPEGMMAMALILFRDTIRATANQTLEYFKKEQVDIKIISGDNLATVQEIAERSGLDVRALDVSTVNTSEELRAAANTHNVFARVTPSQKELLIESMKADGHKVAMTGDGVNDVLALRAADCSIAMATGSDAARCISQFVLTDCDFSALPKVVAEGRRSINNIQGSASLFLVKTVYATLLSIIFMILPLQYPFEPIQLSLISTLSIGLPSFVLALQPNRDPIRGKFFKNILSKALPGGISIALSVLFTSIFTMDMGLSNDALSSICVLVTGLVSMLVLFFTCRPFNPLRIVLFITMLGAFTLAVVCFPALFSLVNINYALLLIALPYMCMAFLLYMGFELLFKKVIRL